jgi:hypothetical protein
MPGIITIESSCFVARFHVDPAKREAFLTIFNALWNYKDENALAALRESEMFQTVVRQLLEQCSAPMELHLLRGMATGREVFDLYPAGPSQVHPAAGPINVMIS